MDERVARLKSPEDCEQFAKNVEERGKPELALQARRRALELRAEQRGAKTKIEHEALQAIYAYEEVLTRKNGRRTSASRTWQMIKRHGILPTMERLVNRNTDASGYTALVEMGMKDLAFEAIVRRYPEAFTPEAVQRAKHRLEEWTRA